MMLQPGCPRTATALCRVALPQKRWDTLEMPIRLSHERSVPVGTCEQGHKHLLFTAALAKPAGARFGTGSSAAGSPDAQRGAANFISFPKKARSWHSPRSRCETQGLFRGLWR